MESYKLEHSASVRFTNDINIGIYIYVNIEDETDKKLIIVDEVAQNIIYAPEE